jgi:acyl carrier protein
MREKIREFVIKNFLFGSPGGLKDNDSFIEQGIIDSTGMLELVAFLDEGLGVKVADEELVPENLDSVDRLVDFISRKRAAL